MRSIARRDWSFFVVVEQIGALVERLIDALEHVEQELATVLEVFNVLKVEAIEDETLAQHVLDHLAQLLVMRGDCAFLLTSDLHAALINLKLAICLLPVRQELIC